MAFVLRAYVELVDEGIEVIQGGTYHFATQGLEIVRPARDINLHVG